jgi:anthranilate synthase component 2
MKILIFDNYDSFTYNLVHLVEMITNEKVEVVRNDQLDLEDIKAYDKIILSPGPGIPEEAGLLIPLIQAYADSKSILGVCLGHQAIAQALGGTLINLEEVYHGIATPISKTSNSSPIFSGLADTFEVGRYHSWVVADENLPAELSVTARDESGYIMAMQHQHFDLQGVQFHPESVLSPCGEQIMRNWLKQ